MKLTNFNENDSVLLLGEGNFSFSVTLSQFNLNIHITATCYESTVDNDVRKKNIECLTRAGVHVLLGVDATNLKEHPTLKTKEFDKIIFNFPHVGGKMRIEKNRELLKQFFISAEKLLKSSGVILVTLCNGQGGTPADNPPRRWDDSWKIVEMAAHGDLILSKVETFLWSHFPDYVVTGYRSLDKQFHSAGALIHFFVKSESPDMETITPQNKITLQFVKNDFSWKDIKENIKMVPNSIQNLYSHTYTFDITVRVLKDFDSAEFFIVLYNYAGNIISDVDFIRSYIPPSQENERRTYRISYKSNVLPLYRERVINIHQNLIANILESNLNVIVAR